VENTLYYGDNLPILREHIKGETIDLIYLNHPFNSNCSYDVLFKDESDDAADVCAGVGEADALRRMDALHGK